MTDTLPGNVTIVRDGIRRIIAPNPGPMTHWGTNTWLVGESDIAVIDPGPASDAHLNAILEATRGQRISHILVTHAHKDHSPLARALSERVDAPVLGFGPATSGRSETMQRLAASGDLGGGEGLDDSFSPDQALADGDVVKGLEWELRTLHTPGHFAGHLSFLLGDILFSGDHVLAWSTSLVSPPDGDLGAFLATSARLRDLNPSHCLTGHGADISEPAERLDWLIQHRQGREREIIAALKRGLAHVPAITDHIYTDLSPALKSAAARNVLAHLIDLEERSVVMATPEISVNARFHLV